MDRALKIIICNLFSRPSSCQQDIDLFSLHKEMYTKGHYVLFFTPYYYPKKLIFTYLNHLKFYVCIEF
jgi:hypothetical protein